MKRSIKSILSIILVVAMLVGATIPTFAVDDEKYICELRLVYADSYREACNIIKDSEFHDYKVYRENLNEGSGEIGVYLAYKVTTDIEDAITDVSVMQMNGGYNEGNYQQMIKRSEAEYFQMASIYEEAIKYWKKAQQSGDFLANAVLRQLNFYTVKDTESLYNGKLLGDVMLGGIDKYELATFFLEGNSYALDNIRSLLAMGVSYNEDGLHYLKKVENSAAALNTEMTWYEDRLTEVNALVELIIPTVLSIGKMFKELSAYEKELNYFDDTMTDLEIKYAEHKSLADRMREINYLNGKTLYEFCVEYERVRSALEAEGDYDEDDEDYTKFYPLVKALNDGQVAMTKVFHYYDVVRYSMSEISQEVFNTRLDEMEKVYKEAPFDIYTGVDRSIFDGSFALTSAAYRENAHTQEGFLSHWVYEETAFFASGLASTALGTGLLVWGICRTVAAKKLVASSQAAVDLAVNAANTVQNSVVIDSLNTLAAKFTAENLGAHASYYGTTYADVINGLFLQARPYMADIANTLSLDTKLTMIQGASDNLSSMDLAFYNKIQHDYANIVSSKADAAAQGLTNAKSMTVASVSTASKILTGSLYVLGGIMLLYSAISLGISIYNYFNPNYDDVPTAMVDLVRTVDGDRYIKYDVVYEAVARNGGDYAPGDTNAYTGHRWNALYYTKSYEAGHPLLAEFDHSSRSNVPDDDCNPIHRFGEVICYDLNKYHMNSADAVYLSIEKSENHKSAVTDVPEIVGSMFSAGWALLAGGIGAVAGIGATVGTQAVLKKKKSKLSDTEKETQTTTESKS